MGDEITKIVQNCNKIMLRGNGGSAADVQYLAAEMLVWLRPMNNREGIPAIALAQDTSMITACGNDFGYEKLFERMVTALGKERRLFDWNYYIRKFRECYVSNTVGKRYGY